MGYERMRPVKQALDDQCHSVVFLDFSLDFLQTLIVKAARIVEWLPVTMVEVAVTLAIGIVIVPVERWIVRFPDLPRVVLLPFFT